MRLFSAGWGTDKVWLLIRPGPPSTSSRGDGRQHDEGPRRASDDLQRQTRSAGRRQYPGSTCAMVALVVEYRSIGRDAGNPGFITSSWREVLAGRGVGVIFLAENQNKTDDVYGSLSQDDQQQTSFTLSPGMCAFVLEGSESPSPRTNVYAVGRWTGNQAADRRREDGGEARGLGTDGCCCCSLWAELGPGDRGSMPVTSEMARKTVLGKTMERDGGGSPCHASLGSGRARRWPCPGSRDLGSLSLSPPRREHLP